MAIAPTQVNPTSQQSSRGYIVDHIVLHHAATTSLEQVVGMMVSGSREVSANYVVKDARIASVVPENMRSWSLSSALWDGRSITFEICNDAINADWPISAASHETVARMCADLCSRYGIPCNRDRILGHREVFSRYDASYATACPGGLDLDWIVQRANQILSGIPAQNVEEEFDMKQIIFCTDLARVRGADGKSGSTTDTKAWIIFGDGEIRVTHNENWLNEYVQPRGQDANSFKNTTLDKARIRILLDTGFDVMAQGPNGGASQFDARGGKMVDGFSWVRATGGAGNYDDTELRALIANLTDKVARIPSAADNAAAARAAIVK